MSDPERKPYDEVGRAEELRRDPNTLPYSDAVAAGAGVTELGWSLLTGTEARNLIKRSMS